MDSTRDVAPPRAAGDLRTGLPRAVWVVLGSVLVVLTVVAALLLAASGLFSGGELSDSEVESVWGFLAATFTAVVTLVGALLVWQQQERAHTLAVLAAAREDAAAAERVRADAAAGEVARDAERRLQIEATAQMLAQLQAEGGGYAPRAAITGAVAGMTALARGTVGIRVLRTLWTDGSIDAVSVAAVLDEVIVKAEAQRGSRPWVRLSEEDQRHRFDDQEVDAAAELYCLIADALLPVDPQHGAWLPWPAVFLPEGVDSEGPAAHWPTALSVSAKTALVVFVSTTLSARDHDWCLDVGPMSPVEVLQAAVVDPDVAVPVAAVMERLVHAGFLGATGLDPWEDDVRSSMRPHLVDSTRFGWFSRVLDRIGPAPDPDETEDLSGRSR